MQENAVTDGSKNGTMFGSDRVYVLPGSKKGDVQMSINPDDLEDVMG
jgi:hypothetical protein